MAELPFPEPPLTDGVVHLRPWSEDDLGFVVRSCQDPEVARFSPAMASPYTDAASGSPLAWLSCTAASAATH
jgi:hypothetical protein